MKLIVDKNLLSFKVLEQKIFDYVCELGRQITRQILEAYDTELAESRDKKHYRGKGKRKTCIKTVYGEVEYKRNVYRTKTEQGENAYVYLCRKSIDGLVAVVQQQFQLDPFQPTLFLFCGRRRDRIKCLL